MNILETQGTAEIIGALQEVLEEQGLTLDETDPRNTNSAAVYTNGRITVSLTAEAAQPEAPAEAAL